MTYRGSPGMAFYTVHGDTVVTGAGTHFYLLVGDTCCYSVQGTENFLHLLYKSNTMAAMQSRQQWGILTVSAICLFHGPGKEPLTDMHSITAPYSKYEILDLNNHHVRNGSLVQCIGS